MIKISIIIPTYNEEQDIRRTLDAVTAIEYENKEIIVVDDASTDRTVEIVRTYEPLGVHVIQQPVNAGVAATRNRGIRVATGEVIVILNADVYPQPDFLTRISRYYENDQCDYLLVEAQITNTEYLYPRYLEAQHHFLYDNQAWINWTEGFSCRKDCAIEVGLFPEKIPGASGEDAVFGENLEKANYRKVIDRSIVVPHVMPHTYNEYWRQRVGRGRGGPAVLYYVKRNSVQTLRHLLIKNTLITLARIVLIFPVLRYSIRLAKFSQNGGKDIIPFAYAHIVVSFGQNNWRVERI